MWWSISFGQQISIRQLEIVTKNSHPTRETVPVPKRGESCRSAERPSALGNANYELLQKLHATWSLSAAYIEPN